MALDAATLALTAAELKTTLTDAKIAPIPMPCCCLPAAALHGCV